MSTSAALPRRAGGAALAPTAWAVLSLAPLTAYALPLWQNILADTPIAYLLWIPPLAVFWGLSALGEPRAAKDDPELDAILGFALLLAAGGALVIGAVRWPYVFVMDDAGLLLWPLWVLGMAWLIFGIGSTRRLLAPLGYLLLCWPPILTLAARFTQGVLMRLAVGALSGLAQHVAWLKAATPSGTFLVGHAGATVPVLVSSACSGADSALGAAILLPLVFARTQGAMWRKLLLAAAALVGAVLLNLVRLSILVTAVHAFGPAFALGFLHQSLGLVLFAALAGALWAFAGSFGLREIGRPAAGSTHAAWPRIVLGAALAAGLFWALWPVLQTPYGAPGRPLSVRTGDPWALLPQVPGFRVLTRHRYGESSVLGPGSSSLAATYVASGGASVLAEVWLTPNSGGLASYGFSNCLLFHGQQIHALRVFDVGLGTPAVDYALTLPPGQAAGGWQPYEDVEWESAVQLPNGTVRYVRYAVAALPQRPSAWPQSILHGAPPLPAKGLAVADLPPPSGAWPKDLLATRGPLDRFARSFTQALRRQVVVAVRSTE